MSGIVHRVEDGDRSLQVCPSGGREFDLAGAPDQEFHPEFAFELADLLRERRLRHVKPRRGLPEVQFLGDRAEVSQMTQLHD
jgi:hypothetical protein